VELRAPPKLWCGNGRTGNPTGTGARRLNRPAAAMPHVLKHREQFSNRDWLSDPGTRCMSVRENKRPVSQVHQGG
jgi:hypothetical protein